MTLDNNNQNENMNDDSSTYDVDALLKQAYQSDDSQQDDKVPSEGNIDNDVEGKSVSEEKFDGRIITANGKEVKIAKDKIDQYLSKGYAFESKMSDLNVDKQKFTDERDSWNTEKSEMDTRYSELKQLDDYARDNPEWLEKIKTSFNQKDELEKEVISNHDPDDPLIKKIDSMQEKLSKYENHIENEIKEREDRKQAESNAKFDSQVLDYKQKFSNLDWNTKDDSGKTLEDKVIDFADKRKLSSFEDAFKLLHFDDFQKRSEIKGKEEAGKSIQQAKKLGLGAITDQPSTKLPSNVKDIRNKSYNESIKEGLAEMGIKLGE